MPDRRCGTSSKCLEFTIVEIQARPNRQHREVYHELKHTIETKSVSVRIGLYALRAGTEIL